MKPFTTLAVIIFSIVAVLHLLRLILGWEITLNGSVVPRWISIFGAGFAGGLAIMLRKESQR